MEMLNNRSVECVATLDRERMALEVVFRRENEDGEWLYWVSIYGEGGAGLDKSARRGQATGTRFSRASLFGDALVALLIVSQVSLGSTRSESVTSLPEFGAFEQLPAHGPVPAVC